MNAVRYEPLNTLRRFQDEVNQMFGEGAEGVRAGALDAEPAGVAPRTWSPAVDVSEEAERFLIVADVPGVDPKTIEITMEESVLSISGERVREGVADAHRYRRVERSSGRFQRRFSLPDTADGQAITASSSHGVLSVSIPKKAAMKPRRIPVR